MDLPTFVVTSFSQPALAYQEGGSSDAGGAILFFILLLMIWGAMQSPSSNKNKQKVIGKLFLEDDPKLTSFDKEPVTDKYLTGGMGESGNDVVPAVLFARGIPADKLAKNKLSAQTVITISWGHKKSEESTNCVLAYVGVCRVTMWDRSKKKVMARKDFVGMLPKFTDTGIGGMVIGYLPNKLEVKAYLDSLLA